MKLKILGLLGLLGLVALAVLMSMAFVGVTSAMAESTSLCTTDEELCAEANQVTHLHESTLAGSPATLLNKIGNVTCDVLFLGDTVAETSAPLVIKGSFTYTNCKLGEESCTVTEMNGPFEVKALREGHETAKVTFEGEVKFKCGKMINCTYNGEGLVVTAKGPLLSLETNGSFSLGEQVAHKVSGFLCPAEANLDISMTPLSPVYIKPAAERMVCIFVGTNNGFYLGASGTTCTNQDESRVGSYELALATATASKTHVCALVTNGFYLSSNSGTKCENQDGTRVGKYELGITQ